MGRMTNFPVLQWKVLVSKPPKILNSVWFAVPGPAELIECTVQDEI